MRPTFGDIKTTALSSLKGRWSEAIAASMILVAVSLLNSFLQTILMQVFKVDAIWTFYSPMELPEYNTVASICISLFSALFSLLIVFPLFFGVLRWFWMITGEEKAYRIIEEDLYALSNPPIFLGENTSVAAEIVDLVVITAHFGFPYSPLEGIARCLQNGYDIDKYLDQMVDMLPILAHAAREQASQLHLETVDDTDVDTVCNRMTQAMNDAGVSQRLNADWLKATNRSVANHYLKMLHIKETNYEY